MIFDFDIWRVDYETSMSCDFKGAERNIDRGPNQKYCTEKLVVECFLIKLLLIIIHLIYLFLWATLDLSVSRIPISQSNL